MKYLTLKHFIMTLIGTAAFPAALLACLWIWPWMRDLALDAGEGWMLLWFGLLALVGAVVGWACVGPPPRPPAGVSKEALESILSDPSDEADDTDEW